MDPPSLMQEYSATPRPPHLAANLQAEGRKAWLTALATLVGAFLAGVPLSFLGKRSSRPWEPTDILLAGAAVASFAVPIAAVLLVVSARYQRLFRTGRLVEGRVVHTTPGGGAILQVAVGVGPDLTRIHDLRAPIGQRFPVIIDMMSSYALVVAGRGDVRRGSLLTARQLAELLALAQPRGSTTMSAATPEQEAEATAAVRPVGCSSCGAPVPLSPSNPTPCRHCGASVTLPATHVELYRRVTQGEAHLRAADALWRSMPRPMPKGAEKLFALGIVGVIVAAVLLWLTTGMSLLGSPGFSFVMMVMLPTFVATHLGFELLAYWAPYARLEMDLSAERDLAYPKLALCRCCGAALTVTDQTIATRCAFCGADNLVRTLKPAAFRRVHEVSTAGRTQIDEAIATLWMLRQQRAMVRWISPALMIPLFVIMAISLWNS